MIQEHERVILRDDLPAHGLKKGDIGTVVYIYDDGTAYELEFFTADGRTLDVITVQAGQIRPVTSNDMLHARALD